MRDATDSEIARLTDYVAGEILPPEIRATQQWIASCDHRIAVTRHLEETRDIVQELRAEESGYAAVTNRVIGAVLSRIQSPVTPMVSSSPDLVPSVLSSPRSVQLFHAAKRYFRPLIGVSVGVSVSILAVMLIGLSGGEMSFWSRLTNNPSASPSNSLEYIARRGEQVAVELVDGSRVMLAAGSRIKYSTGFGLQDRSIYLSGRAYFEVVHHTTLPFVVYAENSAVQVLGTAFVVSAYPSDTAVQVIVRDGKVALRTSTGGNATGIALSAGNLGSLNRTGLVTLTPHVYLPQYIAWTERRLEFRATALADIARELERRYDITVFIHPALATVPVTASFGNEPASEALDRLATGLRATITITNDGRQYRITP